MRVARKRVEATGIQEHGGAYPPPIGRGVVLVKCRVQGHVPEAVVLSFEAEAE